MPGCAPPFLRTLSVPNAGSPFDSAGPLPRHFPCVIVRPRIGGRLWSAWAPAWGRFWFARPDQKSNCLVTLRADFGPPSGPEFCGALGLPGPPLQAAMQPVSQRASDSVSEPLSKAASQLVSVSEPVCQAARQPASQSVRQSLSQRAREAVSGQAARQSASQGASQWASQSGNQPPVSQSGSQAVSQPASKSVSQRGNEAARQ